MFKAFRGAMKSAPLAREKFIVNFKQKELGLNKLLTRCDQDLGGFSTVSLTETNGIGKFHGDLSLDLPEDNPEVVRLGYAMFRTKDEDTGFLGLGGDGFQDWSVYNQLVLRIKSDHRRYFVNIQAETPYPTDLYQHRLFSKTPGQWETISIPFSNFILTNGGVIQKQHKMDLEHIRSVGISLIDGQYGPYELDVEWIKVVMGDAIEQQRPEVEIGQQLPI